MDEITKKVIETVPQGHRIVDIEADPYHPGTMVLKTKPGRGGARPGAGRKCKRGEPLVTASIRITPTELEDLQSLRQRGVDVNKLLGKEIRRLATAYDLADLGIK